MAKKSYGIFVQPQITKAVPCMSISSVVYHVNAPLPASTKKNIHSSHVFETSSWWKVPKEVLKHGSHCLFKHDFKWVVQKPPKKVTKQKQKKKKN